MPGIPWIIKNPSNWSDHDMRCEIGTKCCVFSAWRYRDRRLALSPPAIGVIVTGDWRYLQQRLTSSPTESDITINSHKTISHPTLQVADLRENKTIV